MSGLLNWRAPSLDLCETNIKVGDWVRSYDFEYHDDCYIVGRVTDLNYDMGGCPRFVIEGFQRIAQGAVEPGAIHTRNDRFYPPMNGVPHSFGGYCNGVRKLDQEGQDFWNEKVADWASDNDWTVE